MDVRVRRQDRNDDDVALRICQLRVTVFWRCPPFTPWMVGVLERRWASQRSALPWGSKSMRAVSKPPVPYQQARFEAIMDLPQPPLELSTATLKLAADAPGM
jgi:hypothetical protein